MARRRTKPGMRPEKITWKPYSWMTKSSNWKHFWNFSATGGIGIWVERDEGSNNPNANIYSVVVRDFADSAIYAHEHYSYREALAEARDLRESLNTITKFSNFLREHNGYAGD